jgi:hypothetical protein
MPNRPANRNSNTARVLMFSQRNIYEPEVWRCSFNEFEEIIQQVDSIEVLAPVPKKCFPYRKNRAMCIGKYTNIIINPGIPKIRLNHYYDVFFAICEKPSELLNITAIKGWTDYCKTSICLLPELWVKEMPLYKSSLKVLSQFDYVFSGLTHSVVPLSDIIEKQCYFLPSAIDSLLFSPFPNRPDRVIDVFSLGRRSEHLHCDLLKMARNNDIFYIYDTLCDLHAFDIPQHRLLVANMAKRSRYFIVNPGKFDVSCESGNQIEIGTRYFEGAASGTIMIGKHPQNDAFEKLFFWPDAVVDLPDNEGSIETIIREMDQQPDRQERIRKNNVVQSLRRHDWVYRWETVLETAGLKPMPALLERKNRLGNLADMVEEL